MTQLFFSLLVAFVVICNVVQGFRGTTVSRFAIKRSGLYMTYHERQKPASKGQKTPEKKDGENVNKLKGPLTSAFTQSMFRNEEEKVELEETETKDFKPVTGLGSRLSEKLRLQAEAIKSELGEEQSHTVKNESRDMFAA